MMLTQTDRVIAAARSFRGVSRVDFQLPNVIDGGDPILNFPARIQDAEELGCTFEVIGRRNKCKVFRLLSDTERSSSPIPSPLVGDRASAPPEAKAAAALGSGEPEKLFEAEAATPAQHWEAA